MQRMNVADRMKNGKRPTDGGGATHTKGPHKSGPPHRGPHKAANRRPQRDPHRKHTDISISNFWGYISESIIWYSE